MFSFPFPQRHSINIKSLPNRLKLVLSMKYYLLVTKNIKFFHINDSLNLRGSFVGLIVLQVMIMLRTRFRKHKKNIMNGLWPIIRLINDQTHFFNISVKS
jgi:hypothetical protein